MTLSDVRIERIGASTAEGLGVQVSGDADLSLTRFVVRDASGAAIASAMGATVSLADGLLAMAPACTSSEVPLDLSTVTTEVCGPTWAPPSP